MRRIVTLGGYTAGMVGRPALPAPTAAAAPLAIAAALLLAAAPAVAQPAAPSSPASAAAPGEPLVQRSVLEDDQVRIEELRVRGLAQRIVVRPKMGGAPIYEIVPPAPGRDATSARGSSGQRVWQLLSF